ncbi:MAG: arsenate reductase (glutaredoxin) [Candidatus Omnitrophica bacterium]|jgi:arsenate reductase|nr:arsenate reductase (glutaredoxin) [Candidatus Omnitrophica bacterium COP1]MCL4736466.1 arsenate reductase (glutaredoxin) [Candidatus Omnitrophota bacterium]
MSIRVVIYHNPRCTTSCKVLGLIREKGIEPEVIEYLKTPLSREELEQLAKQAGMKPQELLRKKEKEFKELGLDSADTTAGQALDAMAAHPVLMERPVVLAGQKGVLARPAEKVLEIL